MIARFQAFLRRLLGAASADHRHQSVVRPGLCDLGAKIVAGADGQILFINGSETNLIKANEALAAFIIRALRGWAPAARAKCRRDLLGLVADGFLHHDVLVLAGVVSPEPASKTPRPVRAQPKTTAKRPPKKRTTKG